MVGRDLLCHLAVKLVRRLHEKAVRLRRIQRGKLIAHCKKVVELVKGLGLEPSSSPRSPFEERPSSSRPPPECLPSPSIFGAFWGHLLASALADHLPLLGPFEADPQPTLGACSG